MSANPTLPAAAQPAPAAAAEDFHVSVASWGSRAQGQLGDGTNDRSEVPVAVHTSGVLQGRLVSQISVGGAHSCGLSEGHAYCWGANWDGALGDGTKTDSAVPVAVDTTGVLKDKTVTQVSAGGRHTCAVADGQAYCWGSNVYRQLGDVGDRTSSAVPVAVHISGLLQDKTVTQISAGDGHTCAVADGQAYCWGESGTASVTVDIAGVLQGKTVTQISAGDGHTCAVADGQAYCWGSNNSGQLGDGTTADRSVPVAVNTTGVLQGKTVTQISAGGGHTCAVAGGQAYCWGSNYSGKLGDGTTTNRSMPVAVHTTGVLQGKTVTHISARGAHTCAVADGQASCWGFNEYGMLGDGTTTNRSVPVAVNTTGVLQGKTVTQISAGGGHTCAVADGQAYCWGDRQDGRLGDGTTHHSAVPVAVGMAGVLQGKTVTRISAGGRHTCAVAGGQAYCWGSNYYGKLGDGTTTDSAVPVAVHTIGVLQGKTVTQISAGTNHTCVVADGQAYCWGDNDFGMLGDGTTTDSAVPVAVNTTGVLQGKTVTQISAGTNHTCVVADGQAYCWGDNWAGQLGDGTTNHSAVPVAVGMAGVLQGKTVSQISAGTNHTCVVADGQAHCWGDNEYGMLGDGTTTDRSVPVAVHTIEVLQGKSVTQISAGESHSCVVANGQAYCWGDNYSGKLGDGTTTDRSVPVAVNTIGVLQGKSVTQISAGDLHTCAVADGQAYCWGDNYSGKLGDDTTTNRSVPVAVDTTGTLQGKLVTQISAAGSHTAVIYASGVPSAPLNLVARSGDGQVSVAFTQPLAGGGTALTNFEYSINGGATWTPRDPASIASPLVIEGLSNGTEYNIRLRAVNAAGGGLPSSAIRSTPAARVPGFDAPTGLAASFGDRQVSVAFAAPASDGGAPISNYRYSLDGGTTWATRTPPSAASPLVITGLNNGQEYRIALRAVNALGIGEDSEVVSVVPRTVPSPPRGSYIIAGSRYFQLTNFGAPVSDGGSPITSYQYTLDGGKTWVTKSPDLAELPWDITGLRNNFDYKFALRAVNAIGPSESQWPIEVTLRNPWPELVTGTPARFADTREGQVTVDGEGPKGAVGPDSVVRVPIAGRYGLPESGIGSVAVNITATGPTGNTFITAWPTGEERPNASNLNPRSGQTVPNMAIVKVGKDGSISLYNAKGTTHLIVDVLGVYLEDGDFQPVVPARFADTREGQVTVDGEGPKGAVGPDSVVRVPIAGRYGLPESGIGSVAVNITATGPTGNTFITAWPTGEERPNASNLNPRSGQTVPNMAIVKVGKDGSISLYNAKGTTHLIVDVLGWSPPDSDYRAKSPARFADTREGQVTVDGEGPKGAVGPDSVVRVPIFGRDGLPWSTGVAAVAVNITATGPTGNTFITAWPTGEERPNASNLNPRSGQTVPNMAIVKVGEDGSISLYNAKGTTHLIVDVLGWYPPPGNNPVMIWPW